MKADRHPRDGRYTPLPCRKCCYELYNPWSGFNPCTLAKGWNWLLSTVRTRLACSPAQLAIYNRETNKTLVYWDGPTLRDRRGIAFLRTNTLTTKRP